jgi:acyl carrier protein
LTTISDSRRDSEVHGHVRDLVASILSVAPDKIDEMLALSLYGITSVELIDIAVKLETRFQISFVPETMTNVTCHSLSQNILALQNRG